MPLLNVKKINGGDDFVSLALQAIIVIPSSIFNKESEILIANSKGTIQKISERNSILLSIESEKFELEQNRIIEKEGLSKLKA